MTRVSHDLAVATRRVQSRSRRRPADAEIEELQRSVDDQAIGALERCRVGLELLAERDRHGILKMRAARFDDPGELRPLFIERVRQTL